MTRLLLVSSFVMVISIELASAAPVDVTRVRIVGADNANALRDSLATQPGSPLSSSAVAADVKRLWRLGVFDDVRVSVRAGVVTFDVIPRPRLSRVEVVGNVVLSDTEVLETIKLEPGTPLTAASLARARDRLGDRYVEKRHLLASIEIERRPASASSVDLVIRVEERKAIEVRRVDFVGNRALDDDTLRAASPIARGQLFPLAHSPARSRALDNERQHIARRYLDAGYAEVRVSRPRLGLSKNRRELWVSVPVSEGPRYRLGALTLPDSISADDARLDLEPGAFYDHGRVASAAEKLRWVLEERGHPFAVVTPRPAPQRDARVVDVAFTSEAGPRATIEAVEIRGNDRTRDAVIRRELAVAAGDRYTATAIAVSLSRVRALGFFKSVTPSVEPGAAPDAVVIRFTVVERPTGSFQIGAGYSTVESFIANAGIRQANLFGRGQSLELAMQLSARRQDATIRWRDPHLGGTDWSGGAELYSRNLEWPGFTREATGGAVTLGRPITERVSAQLTYRLEHATSERASANDVAARINEVVTPVGLFGGGLTSSLQLALAYDDRDDRLRTRRGTHAGISAEVAPSWLGSERTFTRYRAWAHHVQPLGGGVGLHLRGDAGLITSADRYGVPLALRFQAGGINDVRGYNPGGLGPRLHLGGGGGSLTEIALGGNLRLTTSVELVVPLITAVGLSGVAFFDVGNVFNLERRYCRAAVDASACPSITDSAALLAGLRASVGAGFRWRSPIGNLRFEWGVPLVRRPGDPRVRFHFGML